MASWAQECSIQDPELVRVMFSLLRRQYDGIGALLRAMRKSTYCPWVTPRPSLMCGANCPVLTLWVVILVLCCSSFIPSIAIKDGHSHRDWKSNFWSITYTRLHHLCCVSTELSSLTLVSYCYQVTPSLLCQYRTVSTSWPLWARSDHYCLYAWGKKRRNSWSTDWGERGVEGMCVCAFNITVVIHTSTVLLNAHTLRLFDLV